ncbi:MAG: Mur ligase family protein [Chloroflexota bacterium]|nr:Mur ligase family protein [Chloroflexota bacterium]MDP6507972.1 Mur ligase family protein [Chloroflexota bacterium]MDP6756616.1 Mur ligase family protein [Chloroflexota bacterium]
MNGLELVTAAEQDLFALIQGEASPAVAYGPATAASRGKARLSRIRALLEIGGRPDRCYPVVHIAGTSGKGSVSTFVDAICREAGIASGLHTTPYLQTPLEKLISRGRMATPREFRDLVDWVLGLQSELTALDPAHEARYGSSWVALTLEYFRRVGVDLAILEAGAGGRFDLTNAVEPLVTAVTSVGRDHEKTLGPTIRDIAWHKAGIFKSDAPAIMLETRTDVLEVLLRQAERVGARTRVLREDADFSREEGGLTFRGETIRFEDCKPEMVGRHQLENAAVAAAIADELAVAGFPISKNHAFNGLEKARMPGRLEEVADGPTVYLDGAHNRDKAVALAGTLSDLLEGRRLVLVLGVLGYKTVPEVAAPLAALAGRVVATEPVVHMKRAFPAQELKDVVGRHCAAVEVEPDPLEAVRMALAGARDDDVVCVAGSIYLVGNVRSMWYPAERVVEAGTSWPPAVDGA